MKYFKKVITLVLTIVFSLAVSLSYSPSAYGSEMNDVISSDTVNMIIEQSKKESGLPDKDFSLVGNNIVKTNTIDSQFMLQSIEEDENKNIALTTIIPYKILEDGEMLNSFQYAYNIANKLAPQAKVTVPTTFVDVTITVITYYAAYQCKDWAWVYRHAGIEAYWSSSNSTVSVSNMLVRYDTKGDLYEYPTVVEKGVSNSTCLQRDYFKRSSINKSNPTKGTIYIDGNNTMPYNRVVYCSNFFEHRGLIYLKLNYRANGTSYVHDRSYYVYTK